MIQISKWIEQIWKVEFRLKQKKRPVCDIQKINVLYRKKLSHQTKISNKEFNCCTDRNYPHQTEIEFLVWYHSLLWTISVLYNRLKSSLDITVSCDNICAVQQTEIVIRYLCLMCIISVLEHV